MKYFIITIDTEGDNLWNYRIGNRITTVNAQYLPRFHELCNRYDYKPVYLVNYEMAQDPYFTDFARKAVEKEQAEIGLHIHAWNTPPHYELKNCYTDYGLPYLIEYPAPIMQKKCHVMLDLLKERFHSDIVSHRAGRWAMNQTYFDILIQHGLQIDCSITPHISWESAKGLTIDSKGLNYSDSPEEPFILKHSITDNTMFEIPVTIRILRHFSFDCINIRSLKTTVKNFIKAKPIWLRPNGNNMPDMLALLDQIRLSDSGYLMFMLHSSELMPGGSPTFKTTESIEKLYADLEILFTRASNYFTGITLKNYHALGTNK